MPRNRLLILILNGVVVQADDRPGASGEYWHRIKTEHGERKEPGCNLELVPKPQE
jgi:hypothetical protein